MIIEKLRVFIARLSNVFLSSATLLILALILIHSYFRLGFPLNTPFDYDQEMIAQKASDIITLHRPTLIGTRVGEYSFYVPPLYIYSSSLFYFIFNLHPLANVFQAYFWSFLSLLALYHLFKKFFPRRVVYLGLLFYTVSPYFIYLERIPWNPNPLVFVSTLTFLIIYKIINTQKPSIDLYILLSVVVGFALNTHFTAIFLVIFTIISLFWFKRWNFKTITIFFFYLFLFILPIILFDLRHEYLNIKGFISLFTTTSSHVPVPLLVRFLLQLLAAINNTGRLLLGPVPEWISAGTGLIVWLLFITKPQPRHLKPLIFIFLLIPIIVFTFYTGDKPEYYYLVTSPIYLIAYVSLLTEFIYNWRYSTALIALYLVLATHGLYSISAPTSNSLGNKLAVLEMIKQRSNGQLVNIVYDMPIQWDFGYNYLINYLHLNYTGEQIDNSYTLIYPSSRSKRSYDFVSGDIGVFYPPSTLPQPGK